MCQLADTLYFEHHKKIGTILYSLEPKNYTKLWVHGNWGRTETGDTTVLINHTSFGENKSLGADLTQSYPNSKWYCISGVKTGIFIIEMLRRLLSTKIVNITILKENNTE